MDGPRIASFDRNDQAHLLRLPAELRSDILSLVLVENAGVQIKKGSSPGLLLPCRQLRAEGLPVYLGTNTFVATLQERDRGDVFREIVVPDEEGACVHYTRTADRTAVNGWLRLVAGLPSALKACITAIHVEYWGRLLNFIAYRHACGAVHSVPQPNFAFWDGLIAELKQAGLTAQQLCWDRLYPSNATTSLDAWRQYMLCVFMLPPLLREHGKLDERRSPGDAAHRFIADEDAESPGYALRRDLERGNTRHEGRFSPPEEWFEEWKASPEDFF